MESPENPEHIRKKILSVIDGTLQTLSNTAKHYASGATEADKIEKGDCVHKQVHKIPYPFYIGSRYNMGIMGKNFESAVNGEKELKINHIARNYRQCIENLKGGSTNIDYMNKGRCLMAETEPVQKIYARLLAKLSKLIAEAETELKEVQNNNQGI